MLKPLCGPVWRTVSGNRGIRHAVQTLSYAGYGPGTLAAGDPEPAAVHLRLVSYTQTHFEDSVLASLAECPLPDETESLLWLQLNGRPGADLLRDLGQRFGLHELALEDVLNTGQRPKVEMYGEHLFFWRWACPLSGTGACMYCRSACSPVQAF